jgi:hypothetical protein
MPMTEGQERALDELFYQAEEISIEES